MSKYPPQTLHIPVLLEQTLQLLNPQKGETYLDFTAGYGGHAACVIEKTGNQKGATLVDQDKFAINQLSRHKSLKGARLLHQDFLAAALLLIKTEQLFDMVLIDLGVSSPQLDKGERGFSFQTDAPLDMRMDQRNEKTAAWFVNNVSTAELTQIIRQYGEEKPRASARIAQAIVAARPIETTGQLATIIKQNHRGKWSRIHPATRTFQALRIATNDELGQLSNVLPLLPRLLKKDGRVAVISFHSLEDGLVKRFFKTEASSGYEATLKLINKKPFLGAIHDANNPRARSSRLRGASQK